MVKPKTVDQVLREAAAAVDAAKVPADLRDAAFTAAVALLREDSESPKSEASVGGAGRRTRKKPDGKDDDPSGAATPPDEATFFSQLAEESGVSEQDLRDVLNLAKDGRVQVIPPSRMLGSTAADQARVVIALVSSARSVGLSENPVDANAVRRELERKRCYQQNNFASKHLGQLKGFNAGSTKAEILVTSKWVGEFAAGIAKAKGQDAAKDTS